jgi:hypothetical protein
MQGPAKTLRRDNCMCSCECVWGGVQGSALSRTHATFLFEASSHCSMASWPRVWHATGMYKPICKGEAVGNGTCSALHPASQTLFPTCTALAFPSHSTLPLHYFPAVFSTHTSLTALLPPHLSLASLSLPHTSHPWSHPPLRHTACTSTRCPPASRG